MRLSTGKLDPLESWIRTPIREPKDCDGLDGGRWVRDGLTWKWRPDPVTPVEPEPVVSVPQVRCKPLIIAGRPVCECGCLLSREDEGCPACLYAQRDLEWCERAEVAASWRPIYYRPSPEVVGSKRRTAMYPCRELTVQDSGNREVDALDRPETTPAVSREVATLDPRDVRGKVA